MSQQVRFDLKNQHISSAALAHIRVAVIVGFSGPMTHDVVVIVLQHTNAYPKNEHAANFYDEFALP